MALSLMPAVGITDTIRGIDRREQTATSFAIDD
jgi:hypothetical protein